MSARQRRRERRQLHQMEQREKVARQQLLRDRVNADLRDLVVVVPRDQLSRVVKDSKVDALVELLIERGLVSRVSWNIAKSEALLEALGKLKNGGESVGSNDG